jgi:hypothetical protein
MRKDYFAGLKGVVVTRVTQTQNEKVTNEQGLNTSAHEALAELLPVLPVLPSENIVTCANSIEHVQPFINQAQAGTTLDDLWAVIAKVRDAGLSLQEKNKFWKACKPVLARFYEMIPSDELIDGEAVSLNERINIEWFRCGWFYEQGNRVKAVAQ